MFRKISIAFILVALVVSILYATQATVTATKKNYGGQTAHRFTFTDGGATTDSALIVPSGANYFNIDAYNWNPITLRYSTSETTADSVLWAVDYQVKGMATHDWITMVTYSDSDAVNFLHVISPATYGYWPLCRFYFRSGKENVSQTVTLDVMFKKD